MKFTNEYRAEFLNGVDKKSRVLLKSKRKKRAVTAAVCLVLAASLTVLATSDIFSKKEPTPPDVLIADSSMADSSEAVIESEPDTSHDGLNTNLLTEVNNFRYGKASPFGENFWDEPESYDGLTLTLSNGYEIYMDEVRERLTQFDSNIDFSDDPEERYDVVIIHGYSKSGPSGCEDKIAQYGANEAHADFIINNDTYKFCIYDRYTQKYGDSKVYTAELRYHRRLFDIEEYCLEYWNDEEHKEAYEALLENGISEEWVKKYGLKAWQRNGGYVSLLSELSLDEILNNLQGQSEKQSFDAANPEEVPYKYYIQAQEEVLNQAGKTDFLKNYYTFAEFEAMVDEDSELRAAYYEAFQNGELDDYSHIKGHYAYFIKNYEDEHGYTLHDYELNRSLALMECYRNDLVDTYKALELPFESCEYKYYCYDDKGGSTRDWTHREQFWIETRASLTKSEIKKLKTLYGAISVIAADTEELLCGGTVYVSDYSNAGNRGQYPTKK